MSKDQIFQEALTLDERDRELLATQLLLSIHQDDSEEIERLWIEEAERRLDAILDGRSIPVDGPEFMEKLRNSHR
jgi:hypothetical protein